jgi:cysteinyl-tRNA synthetase
VDPLALRLALISGQYRKPFNFTRDTLRASAKHVARFGEVLEAVDAASGDGPDLAGDRLRPLYDRALAAMLDDLNTPEAIAAVIEGFKLLHGMRKHLNEASAVAARSWVDSVNALLGIVEHEREPAAPAGGDHDPERAEIDALVADRQAARAARDFVRADAIRERLTALGVEVMDTSEGAVWRRVTAV